VGFVKEKVALGQVFSEYFGFPCQSSFHQLLHNHHQSSGAGTIGQQWPMYQVDSVSPHPEKLKKKKKKFWGDTMQPGRSLSLFLQNINKLLFDYKMSHPIRWHSSWLLQ
jgi:hypothetical protein